MIQKQIDAQTTMRPGSDQQIAVGQSMNRVDGPLKTQGTAKFSAEFQLENMVYGAMVYSPIAKGKIARIDQGTVEYAPGVLGILTYLNAPRMKAPALFGSPEVGGGAAGSNLAVMQNDEIFWNGQPVAVVVAETQEQADYAASLLKVEYQAERADLSFEELKTNATQPDKIFGIPNELKVGDAEAALNVAFSKVDHLYRTPRYSQNAIELHATIAEWNIDKLTVYDTTQSITWLKNTLMDLFNLPADKVRVIAPFIGGGFGGKSMMWNNTVLCVAAARIVGRPVKLVLSREGVFRATGGRTLSEQRVALGADANGKLQALIHRGVTAVVSHNQFPEQFSFPTRALYTAQNFYIVQKTVNLDMVANAPMRAPGDAIGTFALESAIDELAFALKMDPIELRRVNEPARDPITGVAFSSRHLLEAFQRGAERFGWAKRNIAPRSQRDGRWLIGQGVATSYYPYIRHTGAARLRISDDGTATIQAAAHEMGMGTATVQLQYAAGRLGLPLNRVAFSYGDSDLPQTGTAGGSAQTVSLIAAVDAAVNKAHKELLKLAPADSPLAGVKVDQIEARDSGLFCKGQMNQGETYQNILKRMGQEFIEVEADAPKPTEQTNYSMHSYGAQFCEVRVNETTGETRITRWLGSFDCGKILNPKTAVSQFRGGIIMGIGMALTEETLFDIRYGRFINKSLAEYHVPTHLDIPDIDIIYTDLADEQAPLGAHGIGEIGATGAAAAIANAVFNATGKRIRELPITLDKLL